ncbi:MULTISPECIES: hydroxymethylglutaryl-CoA lyase [unclassified Photobacterium]|uniref:hydroxymethylglutaryl-CoA lyase n=1 Tax=unclassified Photobacterium TaxID=2628852 RepID=UPI000D16D70A|nr:MULTISPECIES: hydroxymethylglutaryl-CoA lyase [unclassified Photobacterium]PSV26868.1 hydroxymethylglutaryl-CoA lyase [Photobacterium sp. GB-56]PSV38128.1 hydroxymethylglutaryl-CoA lyase [Photobacterium sp. GB-210]PSV41474.1 hydroxymethylglutaryl-CoA lyase [Photobacterium sp. GB-36]PSV54841.1 hydroxymethylglutaryl-CoA lyase [Photobacterium sp. GB-3]PSW73630.1 hydroxymethylglutaryl-CoA lyase [Photobacterium sp. GB-50]
MTLTNKLQLSLPDAITVFEVGPRDGLQNEPHLSTLGDKATALKIALINELSQTGLTHIESGAFVSPKMIPAMADSDSVFSHIQRHPNIFYSALTPNLQGLEAAINVNANEVAIFTSCSETFTQNNIHASIDESLRRFESVIAIAHQHLIPVRAYLSCVIDCPYEGKTPPQQVAEIAKALIDMGCYQVSLGDTIGTGTPLRVATLLECVNQQLQSKAIAVHFHDSYGQAIANIYQAMQMGITTIDSSIAGLGGCPYAPGASGNVATEDVLYLCQGLNIKTGIDLEKFTLVSQTFCQQLGIRPQSKVALAMAHRP